MTNPPSDFQSRFAHLADFSKGARYKTTGQGTMIRTVADNRQVFLPRKTK